MERMRSNEARAVSVRHASATSSTLFKARIVVNVLDVVNLVVVAKVPHFFFVVISWRLKLCDPTLLL